MCPHGPLKESLKCTRLWPSYGLRSCFLKPKSTNIIRFIKFQELSSSIRIPKIDWLSMIAVMINKSIVFGVPFYGCSVIFFFSLRNVNLSEHCDGDFSCLNKSPPTVSMAKIEDDLDLENFEESSEMKFKDDFILLF